MKVNLDTVLLRHDGLPFKDATSINPNDQKAIEAAPDMTLGALVSQALIATPPQNENQDAKLRGAKLLFKVIAANGGELELSIEEAKVICDRVSDVFQSSVLFYRVVEILDPGRL